MLSEFDRRTTSVFRCNADSWLPVKIEHGLFTWNEIEAGLPPRMGMNPRTHATADISNVVSMFEFWKRYKYNEH